MCGAYNAAAWLSRREPNLAVNTLMYAALIAFEQQHVLHHIAEIRRPPTASEPNAEVLAVGEGAGAPAAIAATEIAA
jgi:hypothetical protein